MKKKQRTAMQTTERKGLFQVHGTVIGIDGKELSGAKVVIWWQHIRNRRQLATGKTSEEGDYCLSFHPPDDAPGQVLVVVEVCSARLAAPLESLPTAAQPDLQIDLEAQPRDRSEFATLLRTIKALLDNLSLLDVMESAEHHDISFLAQELGKSAEQIMRVVVAARLEAAFDIPASVFYAFVQQRIPAALPSPLLEASQGFALIDALVRRVGSLIFGLAPDVQKRTLETAVNQNIIGPQVASQISDFVNRLQAQRTTNILDQSFLVGKATLSQLLDMANLAKDKHQVFAQALVNNTQSMRQFWKTLGDGKHGFTAAESSAVQRTLEVGAFVKTPPPLVEALLEGFS